MRLKVIACNVLFREICLCAAYSRNVIDMEFLEKGLHDEPDKLRSIVQTKIDEIDGRKYKAVVLGYALCSNSLAGIRARDIPIVIPKAHDCITLFLGSKESYKKHHDDVPGTYYYTSGWMERSGANMERKVRDTAGLSKKYREYVEKYGEDNARYIIEIENSWVNNYSRAVFIDVGFMEFPEFEENVRKLAEQSGWEYKKLSGSIKLIEKLVNGEWSEDEFLIVPSGGEIIPSYDNNVITFTQPQTLPAPPNGK